MQYSARYIASILWLIRSYTLYSMTIIYLIYTMTMMLTYENLRQLYLYISSVASPSSTAAASDRNSQKSICCWIVYVPWLLRWLLGISTSHICNGNWTKKKTHVESTCAHYPPRVRWCDHNATHCNTLQYTATHCSTLQYIAASCNTL